MLVVSSTLELARQLIDELERGPAPSSAVRDPAAEPRTILYHRVQWSGLSRYLGVVQKRLVTQNMLEQGNSPEDAAKEISVFLGLLDHLGRLESENRFAADRYEVDLRFIP